MPTTPPSYTTPPAAPSRTSPTTFATRADAWVGWLEDYAAEVAALAANVHANAVEANDDATTTAAHVDAAAASAATAAINAAAAAENTGAPVWVSGTTYAEGDAVYSPASFLVYRRKVAGGGTTDPSADPTNWAPVSALPILTAANKGQVLTNDGVSAAWGQPTLTARTAYYAWS